MNDRKISEIYNNILMDLRNVQGVKMIALGSRDGFLLGESATDNNEKVTQLSAAMLKVAETFTNQMQNVSLNRVVVDFKGGKLITEAAGPKALISVMAAQDASIDPIIRELDRTAGKIKEIL